MKIETYPNIPNSVFVGDATKDITIKVLDGEKRGVNMYCAIRCQDTSDRTIITFKQSKSDGANIAFFSRVNTTNTALIGLGENNIAIIEDHDCHDENRYAYVKWSNKSEIEASLDVPTDVSFAMCSAFTSNAQQ